MTGIAPKVNYFNTGTTAGKAIKATPGALFGIVSTVTGGSCVIYDNASAASGNILFSKTLAVGDIIHFGGVGIAANNGLYIVVTGTVNVLYT